MTDRNLYLAEVLFPYDWSGGVYSLDGAADVVEMTTDSVPSRIHDSRVYSNYTEFPGSYPLSAPAPSTRSTAATTSLSTWATATRTSCA